MIVMIIDIIIYQRFNILERYCTHFRMLAAMFIIIGNPKITIKTPTNIPAVFTEPSTGLRSLRTLVIIPSNNCYCMIWIQSVAWWLIMNIIGVYELTIIAQARTHDSLIYYFLFNGIDTYEVGIHNIPFDVSWIIVMVACVIPFWWRVI